jgi:regulator of protease activity HflC (stomatin/prohibitin superfamily)
LDIFTLILLIFVVLLVVAFLSASIKIVKEYERAVIFRLGRLKGVKGPGIFFIIPFVDSLVKVDLRAVTVDVPRQEIITRDNVTVNVDAVIYYRVVDPEKAITKVANYPYTITLLGQTALRDVIGQVELDDLLSKRDEINKRIQAIIDETTMPWGIKVVGVTLKSVELPEGMKRAMAKQAEAERWRRARIIEAEGEKQASKILAEAAEEYEKHTVAIRLRELQTLTEIAKERALIVVTETSRPQLSALPTSLGVVKYLSKEEKESSS